MKKIAPSKKTTILGIESSCDETSIAIIEKNTNTNE